jgi:glycosyltransferase involved in cell wall biosynthesis
MSGNHVTTEKPTLRIALVVATYNRAQPLDRLLSHLPKQSLPTELWQVVIVVDGSTDDTCEVLRFWERCGAFHLTWLVQENAGPAAARHAGILHTQAERIAIVDDDMELAPHFLQAHVDVAQHDPQRVVAIGRIRATDDWRRKVLHDALSEHTMEVLHTRLTSGKWQPNSATFATGNVSFNRCLYLSVGGFDVQFRLDEDRDLGVRFARAGGQYVYCPAGWAIHHCVTGPYEAWLRRQRNYGTTAVLIWRKYGEPVDSHPLRNFVVGSRLNRWVVLIACPVDQLGAVVVWTLRRTGQLLQSIGLMTLALATHKVIRTIEFHRGVRDVLGSWSAVLAEARRFIQA